METILIPDTDTEVRHIAHITTGPSISPSPWWRNLKFSLIGILFGILLVKSEAISWYRIQEMFLLQSFHMYGVIGSAVVTGIVSVWIIRRFNIKTTDGEQVQIPTKKFNKGLIFGGLIFGLSWPLTGACPGPLFAQFGTGATVVIVAIVSSIAGTWVYGFVRERLPH
jgi:uncharacterized membrane protein YedE/YeeE